MAKGRQENPSLDSNQERLTKELKKKEYDSRERFLSYHAQVSLIQELEPKKVLNIGAGNGFLKKYFAGTRIKIIDADIDPELRPDVIIDISKKQSIEEKYDVVTAFQLLEHIPFSEVGTALENMHSFTKKWAVISVPYRTINFFFKIDLPLIKIPLRIEFERFFDDRISNINHQWEMGLRKTRRKDFEKIILKWFNIEKQFVLEDHRFHYFFLLSKK